MVDAGEYIEPKKEVKRTKVEEAQTVVERKAIPSIFAELQAKFKKQ